MVKIMENPIKMDDLGGNTHYFWKHPYPTLEVRKIINSKVPEWEWDMGQLPLIRIFSKLHSENHGWQVNLEDGPMVGRK